MPIPFLLAAAAVAAAGYGVKKGLDAKEDNKEAERLSSKARRIFNTAKQELENSRIKTTNQLTILGQIKLETWDNQLGHFVESFEKIRNVKITGKAEVGSINITKEELIKMKNVSLKAGEVIAGGVAALGTGALVGVATYGGATMLAAASTGTAISSLAGAAATNATLAWFGGGSLAAGGLGMAGGMAVLGGIVAGPLLAVGGIIFAAKAAENLAEAKSNYAEAMTATEEVNGAKSILIAIGNVSSEFIQLINEVSLRMDQALVSLDRVIETSGVDYKTYNDMEKQIVHNNVQFAQVMKILLETPILTKDGALTMDYNQALIEGRNLLVHR